MKEIFSISTGVDVTKTKPSSKTVKEIGNSDDKSSSKDFLSVLFSQIKESIQISNEDSKLSLKLNNTEKETKVELNTKSKQKSFDNHLLEDLLKIISFLKNPDTKTSSFPSLSNKLVKLINSETALKELKNVNNITDLLKLSKKYDLGLQKISVKKMDFETLKKEFPILAKKEFFVRPKEETLKNEKILIESKKELEIKPTVLSINNIEKLKTKKEPTLFEKIMSSNKEEKKEAIVINKEIIKDKIVEEKRDITTLKINEEVKKSVKIVQEETTKIAPKIIPKEEQKEIKIKEELHVKIENETKKSDVSRINEVKIETNIPKKGMIEDILQGIKKEKQTPASKINTILNTENIKTETTENSEIKTEPTVNRNEIKPQIKTETLSSKQLTPTKETFSNFAADFKEKLENYKPPFMRVQLALNPKGLGEVDVVIVNRGNNLHVNISSNTNTMSLFTQNQSEFKNSLVNMGFTNLDMNFSEQKENKEQQQKNKASQNDHGNFEDENTEEGTTSIELIVPQYV